MKIKELLFNPKCMDCPYTFERITHNSIYAGYVVMYKFRNKEFGIVQGVTENFSFFKCNEKNKICNFDIIEYEIHKP